MRVFCPVVLFASTVIAGCIPNDPAATDPARPDPQEAGFVRRYGLTDGVIKYREIDGVLHVVEIDFRFDMKESDLEAFSQFRYLESLSIRAESLLDESFAKIQSLYSLKRLRVSCADQITDAGMAYLGSCRNLESLCILGSYKLTIASFRHISGLKKLRELELRSPRITAEAFDTIADLPLEVLWFPGGLGDEGLAKLKAFPNLRVLRIGSSHVTDAGMRHVAALDKLEELYLDPTDISDVGLANLAALKNLRVLRIVSLYELLGHVGTIKGFGVITDAGLAHLAGMTKMENLWVEASIRGPGLVHLRKMQSLERLRIGGRHLRDDGLEHIAALRNLRDLDFMGSKITDAGLAKLHAAKSLKAIGGYSSQGPSRKAIADLKSALPDACVGPP